MKRLLIVSLMITSFASGAMALKWSDRDKVEAATQAIAMADALAAGTPEAINCRIGMSNSQRGDAVVEVVLQSGQQAFTNLLATMTTKINNDKATAEAYLASVGVTNE